MRIFSHHWLTGSYGWKSRKQRRRKEFLQKSQTVRVSHRLLKSSLMRMMKNFREWVFKKQAGTLKFNEAQMSWLRMIKDHIATSIHIEYDDLDYTPFDALGGKGKMWQLFGDQSEKIIEELNEVLAA
jgi:type I site-specific restriction endonuclease